MLKNTILAITTLLFLISGIIATTLSNENATATMPDPTEAPKLKGTPVPIMTPESKVAPLATPEPTPSPVDPKITPTPVDPSDPTPTPAATPTPRNPSEPKPSPTVGPGSTPTPTGDDPANPKATPKPLPAMRQ